MGKNRLKAIRLFKEYPEEKAAEKLNMTLLTYRMYEKIGEPLRPDIVEPLAKEYEIDAKFLAGNNCLFKGVRYWDKSLMEDFMKADDNERVYIVYKKTSIEYISEQELKAYACSPEHKTDTGAPDWSIEYSGFLTLKAIIEKLIQGCVVSSMPAERKGE